MRYYTAIYEFPLYIVFLRVDRYFTVTLPP